MDPFVEKLLGLLMLSLAMASVVAYGVIVTRLRRGQAIVPFEPRRIVPWAGAEILVVVFSTVFVHITVAGVVGSGTPAGPDRETQMSISLLILNSIAIVVSALLAAVIMHRLTGAGSHDFGFGWSRIGFDFRTAVGAFLAVVFPVYLIQLALVQLWPSEHPLVTFLQSDGTGLAMLLGSLTAVVVAPITEEFIFRGLIQGWLEAAEVRRANPSTAAREITIPQRQTPSEQSLNEFAEVVVSDHEPPGQNPYQSPAEGLPPVPPIECELDNGTGARGFLNAPRGLWPVLISSAIFAVVHYRHGPDPIPLFVLALVLGYLYQRTHRLWASIFVHCLLNGTSMLLLWLQI